MTLPNLNITVLDGTLGTAPPTAGGLRCIIGPSTSGALNTPTMLSRVADITSTFGGGQLVEAAAYDVEAYGSSVLLVRSAASTAGTLGSITKTGTGTSTVTCSSPAPNDDYDVYVVIVTGGTVGTAGITLQWSLDGGRTLSPVTALGTANTFALPGAGTLTLSFAAGTFVAGDTISARATGPQSTSSDLAAALTAAKNSAVLWEVLHVVSPIDATIAAALDTVCSTLTLAGRPAWWIGSARVPTAAETEATYLTAMNTAFALYSTVWGALCAGAAKIQSSVTGRNYRRPTSFAVAPFIAAKTTEEGDAANVTLGTLPRVQIVDANGNVDEHNEAVSPGLDDARFITLRTVIGYAGVYITRPRLFSAAGSDFYLVPHRRVMNLAISVLRAYFTLRLNSTVRVDRRTGYIRREDAVEMERGAIAALSAALLTKPKASSVSVSLSRTDNILSTKTLTVDARIVPLGYVEGFNLTLGYLNPALRAAA